MARRRRPVRVCYDDLYLYFQREPGIREISSLEWYPQHPVWQWVTSLPTDCGMFLYRPPLIRECCYLKAPLNSVQFARTSGDGIHYSFLVLDGHYSELSPVVRTNPSSWPRNVIVGGDLTEFLRLGLRTGYFALPYLPTEEGHFDDPATIEPLEAKEFAEWLEPWEVVVLKRLAARFGLEPLEGVAERLADLQRRYQPLLQQPPDRPFITDVEKLARERLRPGDRVIWHQEGGGLVRATVLAVTARRVTIAAEDPDGTGAGVVTRHVGPLSLRLQPRGPSSLGRS